MSNTKQLVFIDESGDPGFTFKRGSSKVFVIVCVVFEDELEAEKCALAIKVLRRNLNFPIKQSLSLTDLERKSEYNF